MKHGAKNPARVLIIDDQYDVRTALEMLLVDAGYSVSLAQGPDQALAQLRGESFDGVLCDMNFSRDTTSGAEGLALLGDLLEIDEGLPVVAMTAWGSVDLAVQAMQVGAVDFIEKPWENNRLLTILRTQIERARALDEADRATRVSRLERRGRMPDGMIAESDAMREALDMARRVAPSDATVLITGDNGVGKGLLAERIHAWSGVSDQVFVSVNMGSIPESLFEAEMFGHAKGAFTDAREARAGRFELANGGSLFLDEIGTLPMAQQAKLLRVLETGRFERVGENRTRSARVRLIAATNADLQAMVERDAFRRDLYFRLNTIEIRIPPLAERLEDVLPLADRFLERFNRKYGRRAEFSGAARDALRTHDWPGNVRELAHAVERAVLLCGETTISPADLMLRPELRSESEPEIVRPLNLVEREAIERALQRCDGDVNRAADALGLSRSAMYRRLDKHGIRPGDRDG